MHWQEAWEQDKYEVGRAMHHGWKRQKIVNGFADHPFEWVGYADGADGIGCKQRCGLPASEHHDDMIDWDDLPPHQQAINFEGGREGYRLGFERARLADQAGAGRPSGEVQQP